MNVDRAADRYRQCLAWMLPEAFRQEAEAELVETFRVAFGRVATASAVERARFWIWMLKDLVATARDERRRFKAAHAYVPLPPSMQHAASSRGSLMDVIQHVRFGARALLKNRAFAATAILTLALGIGSTVTIFSVVNSVLLEPLPYRNPSQLVVVLQELRARGVAEFPFPNGDIPDLKAKGTLLEDVATVQSGQQTFLNESGQPEQVKTAFVTPNLFQLLGLEVTQGRTFEAADGTPLPPQQVPQQPAPNQAAGAPPAAAAPPSPPPTPATFSVIISHEYWQRRYGGRADIVGQFIPFGGGNARVNVIGVAAPNAELLFPPRHNIVRNPDVWFAQRTDFSTASRTTGAVRVIARMKPGVTVEQTQAQMEGLAKEFRDTFPVKRNAGVYINAKAMHSMLVSDVRISILALMGAVVFVLLIACANVANLMVTQAMRREREFAVRTALGANRGVLVRQVLAESLILATVSASLGVALAYLGIVVLQQIGPVNMPRLQDVIIDLRVLGFAAGAALLSAMLFGLWPALRASRPNLIDVLQKAGRSAGLSSGRLRNGLVVVEVALTCLLLVGAGLMLRSLVMLQRVQPGYDPQGVLTFVLGNVQANSLEARVSITQRLREGVLAVPGITGVAGATPFPLDGATSNIPWGIEGTEPAQFQQAAVHNVLPGYFEMMRTPVRAGRTYTDDDRVAGRQRIVIDERLAEKAYPGQNAVGRPLMLRVGGNNPVPWEIIGVVAHQRHTTLAEDGREALFFVDGAGGFANRWAVRTSGDPAGITESVRQAIARIDNRILMTDIQPMSELVNKAQAPTRFALVLMAAFAVVALVLAAVGLYGVLTTLVRQRTAEIGVRMAFGAERSSIFRLIVGRGLILAGVGMVIGIGAALGMTRVIRTMLVGVQPTDPLTFVGISVVFLIVAAAACGLPALRASRVDPIVALRSE